MSNMNRIVTESPSEKSFDVAPKARLTTASKYDVNVNYEQDSQRHCERRRQTSQLKTRISAVIQPPRAAQAGNSPDTAGRDSSSARQAKFRFAERRRHRRA